MAIQAPIDAETHRWLRAVTLGFTEGERRRRHPPVLWSGHRDQLPCRLDLAGPDDLDAALRADLAAALLVQARFATRRSGGDEGRAPWLWLTRRGRLDDDGDDGGDAEWAGAARAACAELALPCRFVVVVHHGWQDPVSGVRREWVRLRRRS